MLCKLLPEVLPTNRELLFELAIQDKEEYRGNKYIDLIKWYRAKFEHELHDICQDVIDLLNNTLIVNSTQADAKVFYMKMKGDYYRYLCEFLSGEK